MRFAILLCAIVTSMAVGCSSPAPTPAPRPAYTPYPTSIPQSTLARIRQAHESEIKATLVFSYVLCSVDTWPNSPKVLTTCFVQRDDVNQIRDADDIKGSVFFIDDVKTMQPERWIALLYAPIPQADEPRTGTSLSEWFSETQQPLQGVVRKCEFSYRLGTEECEPEHTAPWSQFEELEAGLKAQLQLDLRALAN